jgi:hypothetical protein
VEAGPEVHHLWHGAGARPLQGGKGFKAPTFPLRANVAQTKAGLGSIWGQAQGGNPLAGQSEGAISGILGGATNQKYNDLYANSDNTHFADCRPEPIDQIANDVQRQFSGLDVWGSAADTGALVDQIGRFRTRLFPTTGTKTSRTSAAFSATKPKAS